MPRDEDVSGWECLFLLGVLFVLSGGYVARSITDQIPIKYDRVDSWSSDGSIIIHTYIPKKQ